MCLCFQVKAREAGLWNLFLPAVSGLSQLDYAYIAEETGRCFFAPEVFNCQAPGNRSYMWSDVEIIWKPWTEPFTVFSIESRVLHNILSSQEKSSPNVNLSVFFIS